MFALLHLCDSLFPIGGFSHSDGLEAATAGGFIRNAEDLRQWMDACLNETLAKYEGPGVWRAWSLASDRDWPALELLDAEVYALRPSSAGRAASRAMGSRLVKTWQQIRPTGLVAEMVDRCGSDFTLPVAFGAVCAASDVEERAAVEGFIYTRLAATVSSAMRLMPIGQHEAHALLSSSLGQAPLVVDAVISGKGELTAFAPAFDIASMSQQYVHSRLFRS